MPESMESQPGVPLAERVARALSWLGIDDTRNNFYLFSPTYMNMPAIWPQLTPAESYEGHMRKTYASDPALADAILAASDPTFVARFDSFVDSINEILAEGVTTEAQADAIAALAEEANSYIKAYRDTLPKGNSLN